MDNIIKPNSSWSKWTDMNTILRNQRIAIMIITVIIVMGIILSKTLNVSNTKNLFVGKNMWKSDLWGKLYLFIAIYGFVDAILVHLYWWCYQITWKKKKARDINTKSKKIIIRFIEVWNCPWMIFVNLLYMNLKKLNMEILVEYMSEIIFAISLTGTLSPLYVIIISFFMQKIPYSLSVKAEAKLLVFLSLICMGMVQKIVLKRELKKCTRKDVNYERIYWKIERYVSCTLIYKYSYDGCEDKGWRWAAGRDPVNYLDLNKFVEKTDTSYYQIISDKTDFVYVPKKEKLSSDEVNKYHLGKRDGMYNNIGSAFSIKVAFGNNNSPLVEGILTVSTYGKHFTDNIDIEKADDVFKRMIIDEIFPYYKRLIELEFGMLYLRHVRRDVGE